MKNPFAIQPNDPIWVFETADELIANAIEWDKVDEVTQNAYFSDIIPACAVVHSFPNCVSIKGALDFARKVYRGYQREMTMYGRIAGYGHDLHLSAGSA